MVEPPTNPERFTLERDGRLGAEVADVLAERMAGVAFVRHNPQRCSRKTSGQAGRQGQLMGLPWCQGEGDGTASGIRDHTGFGAKAATASAKRLTAVARA